MHAWWGNEQTNKQASSSTVSVVWFDAVNLLHLPFFSANVEKVSDL